MKVNRLIWLLLWLLSLKAISSYGGAVSYGFFYCMTLIPVFSLLYLIYCYCFLRIYQYTEGGSFIVNEAVPYRLRLINEYHLPFVGIKLKTFSTFSTVNDLSSKTDYEVVPGQGLELETTIVCHYRGEYEIGIKEVIVTDYFRLFSLHYKIMDSKRVTVNPQIVKLENLGKYQLSKKEAANKTDTMDIITREYIPSDDLRFINWNQSARIGSLMTRERIGEEGKGVTLIMDTCRYSEDSYKYLPVENKILELIIAIALFYSEKNSGVRELHVENGIKMVNYVQNSHQFELFYFMLSKICFDRDNAQKNLMELVVNDNELYCSDVVYMVLQHISDEVNAFVDKITEQNINVVIFLVSDSNDSKLNVKRSDLVEFVTVSPDGRLEEL